MAEERKVILEREYIVPLREEWLKAPRYKRGKKALKTLKSFIAKHMKVYDRDLDKIKVDIILNNEVLFRGVKKPLGKVKVKAIKYDDGIVVVKLVNLPKHIEFELARKARQEVEKLTEAKTEEKPVKEEEKKEETEDAKEKKESSKLETEQFEKSKAKEAEHTSKTSGEAPKIQRKALKR